MQTSFHRIFAQSPGCLLPEESSWSDVPLNHDRLDLTLSPGVEQRKRATRDKNPIESVSEDH